MPTPSRFPAPTLNAFATGLLQSAGLEFEKAHVVAEILVEADLLGHSTHGLQLLAPYLEELAHDRMAKTGAPLVLADYPAAVTWDGMKLPGPWLVVQAIALATARARINGTCSVVIRRSHHIACLAAYLQRVTEQGLMALLTCSDPRLGPVAPHGGRRGVFTPNPIAAAWPTDGDPVIIDTSMSISSFGQALRLKSERRPFPGAWALDANGEPTHDPAVLFGQPRGALLPIGGIDHGHKGYALGLLVETLTSALAGHGRADAPTDWTNVVFLQVFEPACFGGTAEFRRQTASLAAACRQTPPRAGVDRVRLPGEAGLQRRADQLQHGVKLHPDILPALAPWAEKLGVPLPAPA
ncbi:MAG TPA: Ldh family oxidoreductase [Opitutaceae bacterium]|nr:Ldh family oxidoreductase [Opitutaceae bacterium]